MQRNNGFMLRLIGALAIALIGFLMYWSKTEINPVTGQKQHVAITPAQEVRLGLESAPQMSNKMGGELSANDSRTQEVQRIGNLLVSQSDAKKGPWKFQFHVLSDAKTVNAFALPGGQIFITLGLLNKLQTEAQLAGVLGHEIGHVIERHTAEQMAKSQLGQMLVMAVATGASDPRNSSSMYSPAMIASVVNHMFQLRYSRHDESEADIWGVKLMEQAGYNPWGMVEVLKILKAAGGRGQSMEMFQTHPNPDLRIQQITEYLEKHHPRSNLTEGRKFSEQSEF